MSNEIMRAAFNASSGKVGGGSVGGVVVENSNNLTTNNTNNTTAAISNSLNLFASYIQSNESGSERQQQQQQQAKRVGAANRSNSSSYSRSAELNSYYRGKLRRSLTYLITHGYFQTVRSLIQSKTVDLDETDEWWLLNPNVELVNKKCLLIRRDRYRILSRLQSSIDSLNRFGSPQQGIALGRTPLMLSSMIDDDSWAFSIAQMLFENGAQLDLKDSLGYSALMYACLYERARIMELFLNATGSEFDIFDKDHYGNTVFHLASMHPTENMCSICATIANKFGFKKETIKLRNYFKHTPMDLCFLNEHQTCIKRFYEQPVNKVKQSLTLFDSTSSQMPKLSSASTFLFSPSVLLNSNLNSSNKRQVSLANESDSKMLKQQLNVLNIIDKKRILDTYKIVLCLREPLIKVNDKRRKRNKQQSAQTTATTTSSRTRSEYISSGKTKTPIIITRFQRLPISMPLDYNACQNASETTTTIPIKRRGTFEFRRQDILASSLNLYGSEGMKTTTTTTTNELYDWSTMSWRKNVEKLFETVEFQRTKSYRTPTSGSSNNLFEQILNNSSVGGGPLVVVDPAQGGGERKSSLAKSKLNQNNSLQPTIKTSGSSNKSISGGSQKRASVISLKNI